MESHEVKVGFSFVLAVMLAFTIAAMPTMAFAVNAGSTQATAKTGSKTANAKPKTVVKVKISAATVSKIGKKLYTGKLIKPEVKVKYKGKTLVKGKDYRVSYKKNRKPGKASVILKGIGNFTGTKTVKFKIQKKPRAAIVNTSNESHGQLARWLRASGFSVTWVSSISKLDTKKYDVLAIPGGGDVTPSLYGAGRQAETYGTSLSRDRLQIKAIKKFAKAGKPIIGICRGCQILNVAFGGTLRQHIPGWHRGYRTVKIKKDSLFYGMYGSSESVKHSHHQCVKKLGKNLVATQWDSYTGNIEAIEHKSKPIYGLQWHPDLMGSKGVKVGKKFLKVVCREVNNAA